MSEGITRRALIGGAAVVAAGGAYYVATRDPVSEPSVGDALAARRVDEVPVDDPRADAWTGDGETLLPLTAQQLANPKLATATVPDVRVAALHDGTTLGVRLAWTAPQAADLSGVARFQDAAAVMIPAAAPAAGAAPAITMGAAGQAMHIVQWRASWQRDVEAGASQGVEDQFPNVIRDLDPSDLLPPDVAVLWNPARALGNPMAAASRTTPVEELVAEGFGTTTALEAQTATGHGEHHEREWWVVIAMPMARGRGFAPLAPGATWPLAVAVWDGSGGNRGGRKHYAPFTPMAVES